MIFRVFPSKDTFITNRLLDGVPKTGSNFGSVETLRLFKLAPISGAVGPASTASLARILSKFDLTPLNSALTESNVSLSSAKYFLFMSDAQHSETLPSSFDVEIQTVSQDWDEGKGHDTSRMLDKGFANWDKAKSSVAWTIPGSSGSGPIVSAHFDTGHENLLVDISTIVNQWNISLPNKGLVVKLSSSLEANNLDYYTKMFHSRETVFKDRRPYIEGRWDDSIKDDRNNFTRVSSGSLYMYNVVQGQLTDIPGVGTGNNVVTVQLKSGITVLKTVSGSHTGMTGIYSASFSLAGVTSSVLALTDTWFLGNNVFLTGTFSLASSQSQQVLSAKPVFISVRNMENEYNSDEVIRFNIFARRVDYNPAVVLTSSANPDGLVMTKSYYQVVNDRTKEVVIPFGTGSLETTRLSYDKSGNFFKFHMSNLAPGNVYKFVFLMIEENQKRVIDDGFKFRVV